MRDLDDALLSKAWQRASRRRRRYGLAALLVLVAVAASVAGLTRHAGRGAAPESERARAVAAMQRALAAQQAAVAERTVVDAASRARQAAATRMKKRVPN